MQYVKKPIAINATQILTGTPIAPWLADYVLGKVLDEVGPGRYTVATDHGVVEAKTGDWILQGPSGEIYPCSDATFRATYDPAPEGPGK